MTAIAGGRAHIDAVLAERARLLAQPIEDAGAEAGAQLVAFGTGSERYAVDVTYVHRIERCTRVTPLPGAARHFAGITNLHGQLVPVIDLGLLIGAAPCLQPAFVIVLGRERAEIGIVAAELIALRQLPGALLRPAQSERFIDRITSDGIAVIDAAAVIANTTHEETPG